MADDQRGGFKAFLKRIVSVPKREIDEQEAEYQRERAQTNPTAPAKPGQIVPATEHHPR